MAAGADTRVRLLEKSLGYADGLVLHTASSGAVPALDETYLLVERGGEVAGLGEIRLNIEYLNGIPADTVRAELARVLPGVDWSRDAAALLADIEDLAAGWSKPARALLDCTLHDAVARAAGVPLVDLLGGDWRADGVPSNHCIMWCPDEELVRRTREYLVRGFTDIKLRIGFGDTAHDLRRFALLRETAGTGAKLAVDANGQWSLEEARASIAALAPFGLAYVEQPLVPGRWGELAELTGSVGVPISLDEDASSLEAVDRLLALPGRLMAHLKIVKLGGIGPVMEAARRLAAGGAGVIVGHMNEGAAATAAAVHCAMAARSESNELYGADGIAADPVAGLDYANGRVRVARGPGLGVTFDPTGLTTVWDSAS